MSIDLKSIENRLENIERLQSKNADLTDASVNILVTVIRDLLNHVAELDDKIDHAFDIAREMHDLASEQD